MRRCAEYNGEPIAMRLPQEILFRHSAMLLQPVGDRQLRKACPQNLTGLLPNNFQIRLTIWLEQSDLGSTRTLGQAPDEFYLRSREAE